MGMVARIDVEGRWFEVEGGTRVSLGRADAPCRMLRTLAERRLAEPGAMVPWESLFETGWPGQAISPSSALRRVYSAIWDLRRRGLPLETRTGGYMIARDVAVEIQR